MFSKQQTNKWKYVTIAIVSAILMVAIFIVMKNKEQTETVNEQPMVTQEQPKEEPVVEDPLPPQPVNEPEPIDENIEPPQPEKEPVIEPKEDVVEEPEVEIENGYIVGQQYPTEPTYIDGILVVNKRYPLQETYNKGEDPEARKALDGMLAAAKQAGFELTAFSGFRPFDYQKQLYDRYAARDGKDEADRYSARPGYSEHQSGLAFDIGEVGREDLWLTEAFGESDAGKWLVQNAPSHGFILRYLKGKEDITGFMYESWHFRYVGVEVAKEITEKQVTLEEYLNIAP